MQQGYGSLAIRGSSASLDDVIDLLDQPFSESEDNKGDILKFEDGIH